MEFRVLGPLVVEVDGERVQLGPKLRALLTLLLLHANRGVPAAERRRRAAARREGRYWRPAEPGVPFIARTRSSKSSLKTGSLSVGRFKRRKFTGAVRMSSC